MLKMILNRSGNGLQRQNTEQKREMTMGKNRRKTFRWIVLLVMAFSILAGSQTVHASTKKKAITAYRQFLADKPASAYFSVIYLDKNAVPELLYNEEPGFYKYSDMYTYKKGSIRLLSNDVSQAWKYVKKTGVIIGSNSYSDGMNRNVNKDYHKMKGLKITFRTRFTQHSEWDSAAHAYSRNKGNFYYNAKWNTISKKKYKNIVKKLKGSKKELLIKWYKNTEYNRNKNIK